MRLRGKCRAFDEEGEERGGLQKEEESGRGKRRATTVATSAHTRRPTLLLSRLSEENNDDELLGLSGVKLAADRPSRRHILTSDKAAPGRPSSQQRPTAPRLHVPGLGMPAVRLRQDLNFGHKDTSIVSVFAWQEFFTKFLEFFIMVSLSISCR
ncbi:hypothetical protein E2C01_000552 [Portunus trituberculatus]|uniref:Uncharacterized protein n=1 Tax=Portunus trituberculatus TaxID=210409 RepID=A0A5B7CK16_PORTR|nr:hypothetical protein [Portunus trituberculatus]